MLCKPDIFALRQIRYNLLCKLRYDINSKNSLRSDISCRLRHIEFLNISKIPKEFISLRMSFGTLRKSVPFLLFLFCFSHDVHFFFGSKEKNEPKKKLPPGIFAIPTIVFLHIHSIAKIMADFWAASFGNKRFSEPSLNLRRKMRIEFGN